MNPNYILFYNASFCDSILHVTDQLILKITNVLIISHIFTRYNCRDNSEIEAAAKKKDAKKIDTPQQLFETFALLKQWLDYGSLSDLHGLNIDVGLKK